MISLNPNFRISNVLLAYCVGDWREYQKVRKAVSAALQGTSLAFKQDLTLYANGVGLALHTIVYISDKVETLEDVEVVCFGENHSFPQVGQENSAALDALSMGKQSVILSEGVQREQPPLANKTRAIVATHLQLSSAQAKTPIFGFDLEDDISIARSKLEDQFDFHDARTDLNEFGKMPFKVPLARAIVAIDARIKADENAKKERRAKFADGLAFMVAENGPTFPKRVVTMALALERSLKSAPANQRIFCMGGTAHFQEDARVNDPRFKLDRFYSQLKKIPAMVLVPKSWDQISRAPVIDIAALPTTASLPAASK